MPSNGATPGRQFAFTEDHFQAVRTLVGEHAGIHLAEAKRDMVYGRLVRRLRALKLSSFDAYLAQLQQDGGELVHFVNALTTNLTSFFREPHHFEFLADELVPELVRRRGDRRLRVWSAGCSTGEEPYSIAMVLKESVPAGWDVRILATDLDSNVVATAERGVYDLDRVRNLGRRRLERWFLKGKGANTGTVRAKDELRAMIRFRQLNLLADWPMRGPLDLIFCRNVVIYFAKETQRRLFDRYANILAADGHLFLGHSESLFKVSDRFRLLGNTVYQKIA